MAAQVEQGDRAGERMDLSANGPGVHWPALRARLEITSPVVLLSRRARSFAACRTSSTIFSVVRTHQILPHHASSANAHAATLAPILRGIVEQHQERSDREPLRGIRARILAETCGYTWRSVHMRVTDAPANSPRRQPPRDLAPAARIPACACGRLRRASRALTQLYDDAMAPAGLRVTQFSLLRTLARDGVLRISELAARQLLDRTALSRNLEPLVTSGYVDSLRGRDARTREVAITRQGIAVLNAAQPHWAAAQRKVARRLGSRKLQNLIEVLGELESLHPAAAVRRSPR